MVDRPKPGVCFASETALTLSCGWVARGIVDRLGLSNALSPCCAHHRGQALCEMLERIFTEEPY
uniref:Uncharacterized protein n=1 Tax=Peronospora matthiolae TaxID=2874970 RepID=A0AAV1TAT5_9STRA